MIWLAGTSFKEEVVPWVLCYNMGEPEPGLIFPGPAFLIPVF